MKNSIILFGKNIRIIHANISQDTLKIVYHLLLDYTGCYSYIHITGAYNKIILL